ncbi:THUMP domain-containing protein 3 [Sarcoptes scabiei]|uniref:THUMP domain-containing protein 3 n=1 Tax=Sarcoptes scabiei TaxID=52283 RepID=A0A834RHT5_SARSC|nr:THUMP domain-containing protein 3 [Sarcoptes scabiei]
MNQDLIVYDCTVVTGLERLAQKEIEQKLSSIERCEISCGHVVFKTTNRFPIVSKLCSVDNIYVILYDQSGVDLRSKTLQCLETFLISLLDQCDWCRGIDVWKEAAHYDIETVEGILDSKAKQNLLSFRVTCNRTGDHKFTSQEAASCFGGIINEKFRWQVSLKKFDLELLLTIKNDSIRIGICLTKETLHKRHIVSYGLTTLRGTIAFNLIQIADIQPGDIVCDPLCGTGVIPIECSINWQRTFFLAGDINDIAVSKSETNFNANKLERVNLLRWDCKKLPLRNNSIDVFITDLPFGRRMGSKQNNKKIYFEFLLEMARCSRTGIGRIVLLTQDKNNANQTFKNPLMKRFFRFEKAFYVNMGGLDSSMYLLRRNIEMYSDDIR